MIRWAWGRIGVVRQCLKVSRRRASHPCSTRQGNGWPAQPFAPSSASPNRSSICADLIEHKKVLLVHLPKGLIGSRDGTAPRLPDSDRRLAGVRRTGRSDPGERHPFSLYVDECRISPRHRFLGKRCSRRAASTPVLERGPPEHRPATQRAAGNRHRQCQKQAGFALSVTDAKVMEKVFAPSLTAEDLQALDPYSVAAVVALDDGGASRPVTLTTPPLLEPSARSRRAGQLADALRPQARRAEAEATGAGSRPRDPRPRSVGSGGPLMVCLVRSPVQSR